MNRLTRSLLAAAVWTPCLGMAQPVSVQSDSTATVLPDVVVTATRTERRIDGLPISVTVIDREAIGAAAGRSIEELLRGVAGVQLPLENSATVFPINPSIAIRGLGVGDTATRALVLVDGLPINGGFFGNVFWNRAPKEVVERVEVVRGASSSLFGSYAIGGVVNVLTRPTRNREGSVEVRYGEDQTLEGHLRYASPVNEALALSLNLDYFDTEGYVPFPGGRVRAVDEKRRGELANAQVRADLAFSSAVKGFVKVGLNHQQRRGGVQLQSSQVDLPDVAGALDIRLDAQSTLALRAFQAREDFDVDNVNVPDPATSFVSNRHHTQADDYGASLQWSRTYDGVLSGVVAGIDARRIDGRNDQDVFNAPGGTATRVLARGEQTSFGLFTEASLAPIEKAEVLLNLRWDRFRDADGRIVTGGVPQAFGNRAFDALSPRLAARYELAAPLALRGSYYQGFRAPTLAERYRSFETPTFRGLSNPDLERERLRGGDVGLDIRASQGVKAQISAFTNRLKNFVGSEEVGFTAGKFTVQAANVAQVRSRGIEFALDMQLTQALSAQLDHTYTDATVVRGPLRGNRVEGTPRHATGIVATYRGGAGGSAQFRGRRIGKTFQDITNEAPQDAHFVLDARAGYRVGRLEWFASATNLLDKNYIADGFGQTLGEPRKVLLGLRADL